MTRQEFASILLGILRRRGWTVSAPLPARLRITPKLTDPDLRAMVADYRAELLEILYPIPDLDPTIDRWFARRDEWRKLNHGT